MTEEIDIEILTTLIKKEMQTVIREEFERVLKVVFAAVRVDTVPHEKRVIVVTQKPHEEEHTNYNPLPEV